jgi:hypothetical protein
VLDVSTEMLHVFADLSGLSIDLLFMVDVQRYVLHLIFPVCILFFPPNSFKVTDCEKAGSYLTY